MTREFGEADLRANLRLQAAWDQAFVDRHFHVRRGFRGQRKLLLNNVLGITLAAEDMRRPIEFTWASPACSRVQNMLLGMQEHLLEL